MKDYSIKISVEKKSNISSETAETVNFHFSHYKSMGTISCHSNQSSYPTGIKNTSYIEANVLCIIYYVCKVLAPSPLWFLRRYLNMILTKIDPFSHPDNQSNSPIWTKVVRNVAKYSINISVKKIQIIP